MTMDSPKEGEGDWEMSASQLCVGEAASYPMCTEEPL